MIDIGTGDGRFVLDYAKKHSDTLVIGIDACRDGLIEASQKASKSEKRGGLTNASFVLSSIEALPADFCAVADKITINYPWGSLLKAVTQPDAAIFRKIVGIGKPGCSLNMLINWSVFENTGYCERLGLPQMTLADVDIKLRGAYHEAGVDIISWGIVEVKDSKTTWGQKLVKGSNRAVLSIEAVSARS